MGTKPVWRIFMSIRRRVLSGFVVVGMVGGFAGAAVAQSANNARVPTGHLYTPGNSRLPALNSRRDKINSRADIYETEIYRSNRDAAITFGNMGVFGNGNFLSPGSRNRPRY
jgi:hypothetical protein